MLSAPVNFLDLPTELKCRIMNKLDVQSILQMSLTSKSINEIIYASDVLVLQIEMLKSELSPATHFQSTAMARRMIKKHLLARLSLPILTSACSSFTAPDVGILVERLFGGLFVCVTEDDTLHVWDIRFPDPTRPPEKILMITEPHLIDVVIGQDDNLLVLLCYHPGNADRATIKLLDLKSGGTQSHPRATSHVITHRLLPGDIVESHRGQQLLSLHGGLLAFVYCRDDSLESYRGSIWAWMTGDSIYDSKDFRLSSDFHGLLLLPSPNFFLVNASSFLVNGSGAALGGWIELRHVDFGGSVTTAATSRLVAEFHLPEFESPTEYYLGAMEFYSSAPTNRLIHPVTDEAIFPFVSNTDTSVHVLFIWYKPRQEAPEADTRSGSRVHLVISNRVFSNVLEKWERRNSDTSFPLRKEWDEWAPWWTSMWNSDDLGLLTATSSVCGSRICSVSNPDEESVELIVVDFNMNFPCSQRDCSDPLAHFYPNTFRPGRSLWARVVRTWLPFHIQSKHLGVKDNKQIICTAVLMDEERMIFSTCVDDPLDLFMDTTSWKVTHLLHEQTDALGGYFFSPSNDEYMDPIGLHDRICRLCKEKPHTDAHILLECTAHPKVVELRRKYLGYDKSERSCDELFNELMARRDAIRMSISSLAAELKEIYEVLPSCSELVSGDQENPASILFVT